jgi:hypothetical protein
LTHRLGQQLDRLDQRLAALRTVANRYSWLRLFTFLAAVIVCILAFNLSGVAGGLALVAGLIVFGVTVAIHRRYKLSMARLTIWREITAAQIARLTLDWSKLPPAADLPNLTDHPFANDLDLTGARSAHHLIDATIAVESGERLRDWFLATPTDPAAILERQALMRELIPLRPFRHKLTLHASLSAGTIARRWRASRLQDWLSQGGESRSLPILLLILFGLAAVNAILFGLNQFAGLPPYWRLTFLVYVLLSVTQVRAVLALFADANTLHDSLGQLSAVFRHLETAQLGDSPRLKALCADFRGVERPSVQLRRAARVVFAASLQRNPILWVMLNAVIPWDIFFARQLTRQRVVLAERLPRWLDAWFTLEAASSLANFAALHPDHAFPQIESQGVVWRGNGLGHPLIPIAERVCNDFAFEQAGAMALITGSNMSGKSSFLRTLGVNMALAYAGGVVCATELKLSPLRLYTAIQINDSLTDGFSYFYAEARRLKALLDALQDANPLPLVFLIDEIFRGTNNRERLIGSRSYIRALVGRNGVGVVSTHDLELVKLADDLPQITNYHFEDEVRDGQMTFDYRLRPGPSPTTNALKIMRQVGLPVELDDLE